MVEIRSVIVKGKEGHLTAVDDNVLNFHCSGGYIPNVHFLKQIEL